MFFSDINSRVTRIKNNQEEIDKFIAEYKPFVANCVAKAIGRFVEYGKDDELSIGLMAFAESIKNFDKSKGNFLTFAAAIVRNRLIDYYRKEKRYSDNVVLSKQDEEMEEESSESKVLTARAMESYSENEISEYRRLELTELSNELEKWDISFDDLVQASPKQEKLRKIYKEAIYYVLCNSQIAATVLKKRYLPIGEIEKGTNIPRKKLERGRKYIIASIIILSGDYEYIRDFLKF